MSPPTTEPAATFDEIYERHRVAVHAYFLGRLGNRESAADLLQETFVRVWRRLRELSDLPAERQRAWIFTVAKNLAVDTYRTRATREATTAALERDGAAVVSARPDDPALVAEYADRRTQLEEAVERLPEPQRLVLALHVAGNLSSAEIGEQLGEPAGTIRYRLSQARQRLAADLNVDKEQS